MYLPESSSVPQREWYELDTLDPINPSPPDTDCPVQIIDENTNLPTGGPWVQVSIRMPSEIQAVFVTMTPTLGADAVSIVE
jgi:hypothetical protein